MRTNTVQQSVRLFVPDHIKVLRTREEDKVVQDDVSNLSSEVVDELKDAVLQWTSIRESGAKRSVIAQKEKELADKLINVVRSPNFDIGILYPPTVAEVLFEHLFDDLWWNPEVKQHPQKSISRVEENQLYATIRDAHLDYCRAA